MLNAIALKNIAQYLAFNWSKTRNGTTKKAFQIPDFSHTLRRTSSSVNLESNFVQLTSVSNSAAEVIGLALESAMLCGSPACLFSTWVMGPCQLINCGLLWLIYCVTCFSFLFWSIDEQRVLVVYLSSFLRSLFCFTLCLEEAASKYFLGSPFFLWSPLKFLFAVIPIKALQWLNSAYCDVHLDFPVTLFSCLKIKWNIL